MEWILKIVAVYIGGSTQLDACVWRERGKERLTYYKNVAFVIVGTGCRLKVCRKTQKKIMISKLEPHEHRPFVVFKLREGLNSLLKVHLIRTAPPRIMFLFFILKSTG